MYSKTAKSSHYLPRKGSYSTVPHRNGRVDVMPPGARCQLFDIAQQISDGVAEIERLRRDAGVIQAEIFALRRVDMVRANLGSSGSERRQITKLEADKTRIDARMKNLRMHINRLKATVSGGGQATFEDIFARLAQAELPDDVYSSLARKAHSIIEMTKR